MSANGFEVLIDIPIGNSNPNGGPKTNVHSNVMIPELGSTPSNDIRFDAICVSGSVSGASSNPGADLFAKVLINDDPIPTLPPNGCVSLSGVTANHQFQYVPMPDEYSTATVYRVVVWGHVSSSSSSSSGDSDTLESVQFVPLAPGSQTDCEASSSSSTAQSMMQAPELGGSASDIVYLQRALADMAIENQRLKEYLRRGR